MRKLARFFVPYIPYLVILLALVYGQTWATLALPSYMSDIVNKGIVAQNNNIILQDGLKMLGVTLLGGVFMIGVSYISTRIATGYARRLREAVFTRVEMFSLVEFNSFSNASLITRSTNDVQQIQQVLGMILRIALIGPFMGVGAIIRAWDLAPSMTWIMALAIVILTSIIAVLFTVALPRFKQVQKLVDRLNLVTREFLTGLRVIRAFNREDHEEKKFDEANMDLRRVNTFVNRLLATLQPTLMLIMNLVSVAIVWVGAYAVSSNVMQVGNVLAFVQYAMQAIAAFLMISMIFVLAPRAAVSAQRIGEVLGTEPLIVDPDEPQKPKADLAGTVTFKDVSFAYSGADKPVLEHISFTAKPGETTAFVGSTGSGKSTLISLIPRFYDVTYGQVLVDGVDVRQLRLKDLHAKVGYAPQHATLFTGTVESNIKYGKPKADLNDVRHAANVAQASDFIAKLDGQYDSDIAQGGTNVSGGQRQRLNIARVLAYKPEIYIFDDSFSALDFTTDAKLRQALKQETAGKTVLIVAQRISTIIQADNIVVLDEGKVVGQGKHDELLKSCSVYREIAESQLSAKELQAAASSGQLTSPELAL